MFDAPSDLQAKLFPGTPSNANMDAVAAFCLLCGGVPVVFSALLMDLRNI
jgi:hypothetical protein